MIRNHGGYCCGIRHSIGWNKNNQYNGIENQLIKDKREAPHGRLIEIVLAEYQLRSQPNLGPLLAKHGFKLREAFLNDNSGNVCYVFTYIAEENRRSIKVDDLPFSLDPAKASPPKDVPVGAANDGLRAGLGLRDLPRNARFMPAGRGRYFLEGYYFYDGLWFYFRLNRARERGATNRFNIHGRQIPWTRVACLR